MGDSAEYLWSLLAYRKMYVIHHSLLVRNNSNLKGEDEQIGFD